MLRSSDAEAFECRTGANEDGDATSVQAGTPAVAEPVSTNSRRETWSEMARAKRPSSFDCDLASARLETDREWCVFLHSYLLKMRHTPAAQPAHLAEGLYLGGLVEARDTPRLERMGIGACVNAAPLQCPPGGMVPAEWPVLVVEAEDAPTFPLLEPDRVAAVVSFINEQRLTRGCSVLVHCFAGVNRSAALAAAYLLAAEQWPLSKVIERIATARGPVLRNTGFLMQLVKLARKLDLLS